MVVNSWRSSRVLARTSPYVGLQYGRMRGRMVAHVPAAPLPARRLEPGGVSYPSGTLQYADLDGGSRVIMGPAASRLQGVRWNHGAQVKAREGETMEPRDGRPITYILPTTAWASLLDVIVREAPAGAVIATYTEAMRALSEQALARVGRADVMGDLRPAPESATFHEHAA